MLRRRVFAGLSQSTRTSAPYICWNCQVRLLDTTRLPAVPSRRSLTTFKALQDAIHNDETAAPANDTASDGAKNTDAAVVTKEPRKGSKDGKKKGRYAGRKKGKAKKTPPDKKTKHSKSPLSKTPQLDPTTILRQLGKLPSKKKARSRIMAMNKKNLVSTREKIERLFRRIRTKTSDPRLMKDEGITEEVITFAELPENVSLADAMKRASKGSQTKTMKTGDVEFKAIDVKIGEVPKLAHGLDRVLFNQGVTEVRDSRTRVFNFDPFLDNLIKVKDFDFNTLGTFRSPSKDPVLAEIAAKSGKRYVGSTSSMTGMLKHFHYLLSNWREPSLQKIMSREYPLGKSMQFTKIQQAPDAVFLRWKNGVYAIDADKEHDKPNILSMLGKYMEKLLTVPKEVFEKHRVGQSHRLTPAERDVEDQYHYSSVDDIVVRSQLDTHDPRLPGTGMFDLKTRAVLPIRMSLQDYEWATDYNIRHLHGEFESYEREYHDMVRATMLKYSLQVRLGRMDGIFVAYHNIARVFGFQYIGLDMLDEALHGQKEQAIGDQELVFSLRMLNEVFDKATKKFPEQSLRLHIETRPSALPFMYIFVEPVNEEQVDSIQNSKKALVEEFERKVLGLEPKHSAQDESVVAETSSAIKTPREHRGFRHVALSCGTDADEAVQAQEATSTQAKEPVQGSTQLDNSVGADGANYYPSAEQADQAREDAQKSMEGLSSTFWNASRLSGGVSQAHVVSSSPSPAEVTEESEQSLSPSSAGPIHQHFETQSADLDEPGQGVHVEVQKEEAAIEASGGTTTESNGKMQDGQAVDTTRHDEPDASIQDLAIASADVLKAGEQSKPSFKEELGRLVEEYKEKAGSQTTAETTADRKGKTQKGQAIDTTTHGDSSFLDQVASEVSSVTAEGQPPILGFIVRTRSFVDGKHVTRVNNLKPEQEWTLQYTIDEMDSPSRARTLYDAVKVRRSSLFTRKKGDEGEEPVKDYFIDKLKNITKQSKDWREKMDAEDAKKSVVVLESVAAPTAMGEKASARAKANAVRVDSSSPAAGMPNQEVSGHIVSPKHSAARTAVMDGMKAMRELAQNSKKAFDAMFLDVDKKIQNLQDTMDTLEKTSSSASGPAGEDDDINQKLDCGPTGHLTVKVRYSDAPTLTGALDEAIRTIDRLRVQALENKDVTSSHAERQIKKHLLLLAQNNNPTTVSKSATRPGGIGNEVFMDAWSEQVSKITSVLSKLLLDLQEGRESPNAVITALRALFNSKNHAFFRGTLPSQSTATERSGGSGHFVDDIAEKNLVRRTSRRPRQEDDPIAAPKEGDSKDYESEAAFSAPLSLEEVLKDKISDTRCKITQLQVKVCRYKTVSAADSEREIKSLLWSLAESNQGIEFLAAPSSVGSSARSDESYLTQWCNMVQPLGPRLRGIENSLSHRRNDVETAMENLRKVFQDYNRPFVVHEPANHDLNPHETSMASSESTAKSNAIYDCITIVNRLHDRVYNTKVKSASEAEPEIRSLLWTLAESDMPLNDLSKESSVIGPDAGQPFLYMWQRQAQSIKLSLIRINSNLRRGSQDLPATLDSLRELLHKWNKPFLEVDDLASMADTEENFKFGRAEFEPSTFDFPRAAQSAEIGSQVAGNDFAASGLKIADADDASNPSGFSQQSNQEQSATPSQSPSTTSNGSPSTLAPPVDSTVFPQGIPSTQHEEDVPPTTTGMTSGKISRSDAAEKPNEQKSIDASSSTEQSTEQPTAMPQQEGPKSTIDSQQIPEDAKATTKQASWWESMFGR